MRGKEKTITLNHGKDKMRTRQSKDGGRVFNIKIFRIFSKPKQPTKLHVNN